MKLKDIYTKLETVECLKESYSRNDFYSHLVFEKSIRNFLADKNKPNEKYNVGLPLFQGQPTGYDKGRQIPLTGNENIAGDFLLLEFIGHYPEITLSTFDTLFELEEMIISDSGILNSFTTLQLPIIDNQLRHYSIEYFSLTTNKKEILELAQYENKGSADIFKTINRRVIWAD